MPADKKPAWIVLSPAEPPADWGFKEDRKTRQFYRIVSSKLHAQQLLADLNRLQLNVLFPPRYHQVLQGRTPRKSVLSLWDKNQAKRILTLPKAAR